jgi:hypothetical protein
MGWQEAPVVTSSGGGWQSAPVLDKPKNPVDLGPGGFRKALEGVISEDASPAMARVVAGFGTALDQPAMRLKQAITGLTPQDEARVQANRELQSSPLGMAGAVAGNLAMVGGPVAAATRALSPALTGTGAAAAVGGATATATNPVLQGESELTNTALGAAGGAAGDLIARGAARIAQPVIAGSRRVANVATTPGQAAGGLLNRIEQQLESLPVVGWFLTGARERAVKEANVEAIKKALPNGADASSIKAGRDGIEKAGEMIDDAYNAIYARLPKSVKPDQAFKDSVKAIPKAEGVDLPPSLEERFNTLIKDRILSRIEEGGSAESIRSAHNSLGALARKYRSSGDPDQRALGFAFSEAKKSLREMVSRQSGGEFKPALDALDNKYSALLAVEKASGYQGSKEGVFSMEALKRASTKSAPQFREFANTASDVLGRTVPDSGTAGRTLLPLATYAMGGGAAAGNEFLGGPEWLTGMALAPLLYSRPGVNYLTGAYPGQAAIAQTLRGAAPYAAQVGRVVTQK